MARLLLLVSLALFAAIGAAHDHGRPPYWQESNSNNPFHMSESMHRHRCGGTWGTRCLSHGVASCRNGACVCNAPFVWGSGDFACYEHNTLAAEIKNDPSLTTFSKETVDFPFPCRYLVTHFKNDLKDSSNNVIGRCEFRVFGYNARKRGKIFQLGFDTAVRLMYKDGRRVGRTTRNYGVMKGKIPLVYSKTSRTYWPNGPWNNENFNFWDNTYGVRLRLAANLRDRQIVLMAEQCGVKITFVPYDVILRRHSPRVPGLSVQIMHGFDTEFGSKWGVMAFPPSWGVEGKLQHYRRPGLTNSASMVWRAFTRNIEQNHPWGAHDECRAMKPAFEACPTWMERYKAMKSCFWMLEEERFMRCVDKQYNADELLELFRSCIGMHCGGSTSCYSVKNMIMQKGCQNLKRMWKLRKFMGGDYCPESWRP